MSQSPPVALALLQGSQEAFLVQGNIRDSKPLPPLPQESLHLKDLLEREWDELVIMTSRKCLNERDLCVEKRIVDV